MAWLTQLPLWIDIVGGEVICLLTYLVLLVRRGVALEDAQKAKSKVEPFEDEYARILRQRNLEDRLRRETRPTLTELLIEAQLKRSKTDDSDKK